MYEYIYRGHGEVSVSETFLTLLRPNTRKSNHRFAHETEKWRGRATEWQISINVCWYVCGVCLYVLVTYAGERWGVALILRKERKKKEAEEGNTYHVIVIGEVL